MSCATWCTDGDEHPKELLRADQDCWGPEHVTVLGLEAGAPSTVNPEAAAMCDPTRITTYAHQKFYALPTVRLHVYRHHRNEHLAVDADFHLTPAEAIELAEHLVSVVEEIAGGGQ